MVVLQSVWFNHVLFFFCLQDERAKMTERIQNAGTEVVEAKAGAVSINTG